MRPAPENGNPVDPELVGLRALGWVLQDDQRARRLIELTGLTPDDLRNRVRDHDVLTAVLGFLEAYEPDLMACSRSLDLSPTVLTTTRRTLSQ